MNRVLLHLEEVVLALHRPPVLTLAGIAGDYIDCGVRFRSGILLCDGNDSGLHERIGEQLHESLLSLLLDSGGEVRKISFPGRLHSLIVPVQPVLGDYGKAGGLQPLLHACHRATVHVPGAGPALHRAPGPVAVQGYPLPCLYDGKSAVVLQKHHALGSYLPGTLHVPGLPGADIGAP